MDIAIISDIHDNIWNLDKVRKLIKKESCTAVIFCGDMCAPFTAANIAETNLPIYAVWGNVDEDHWGMVKMGGDKFYPAPLFQEFNEQVFGNKKIAFCHYPMLGKLLANTGYYDAVFHGHTHKSYKKRVGKTIIANPGAVCGIVNGKPGQASFMVYNTNKNNLKLIKIK